MSLIKDLTKQNLKQFGIQGLSFTMPATTQKLVDNTTSSVSFQLTSLTLDSGDNWLAPFSGILNETNTTDKKIKFNLQKANGEMMNEAGALLRLFPQQILRMKRLIALKFEESGDHNPLRNKGIPIRQVPAFIFISGATGITEGLINAGDSIGASGTLSFYDEQGYILHPLYVLSLIKSLLALYPALNINTSADNHLDALIGTATTNTVRLINADGSIHAGTNIEGIEVADNENGLFTLSSYSGTDTSLKAELKRREATAEDGEFPPIQARQLVLGNVSYGILSNTVNLIKLPTSLGTNALTHDFFTVRIISLDTYLKGEPAESFNGTKLEPKPSLRLNEQLQLLQHGNAIMGKLTTIFSDTPDEALCVATAIDTTLPLPDSDTSIIWPAFPAVSGTINEEHNTFPPGLKEQIKKASNAHFVSTGDGSQPTNIILKLMGIPFGAAVRVFNRVFLSDAVVKRGNGAGGVSKVHEAPEPASGAILDGTLTLLLKDPLGLKRTDGTTTVPVNPQLMIDVMIVLNNRNKRLFGAITIPVESPVDPLPASSPNSLEGVSKKGICSAGILGLNNGAPIPFDVSTLNATLNSAIELLGEGTVRDASRLPTMVRRDMIAAAKKGPDWKAVLSGGQINGNLHNAEQDWGCPGSAGGNETANIGVFTQNGRLAYDMGRMAFRRTTSFYGRIEALKEGLWNEPAENAAPDESVAFDEITRTFAGTVLQNISPFCESPEMALLKTLIEEHIDEIPEDFDALVTQVNGWIDRISTGTLPSPLSDAADRLKTEIKNKLNELKDNNALAENTKERLYNELKREISAACFGRRDTQWSLLQAIKQARTSIYIETPGFSFTAGSTSEDFSVDLIAELNTQMQAKPGLRVILCIPRQPDYQKQYDQWIRSEIKERWDLIQGLPAEQLVVFHPVGFPGRPSNIEQSSIIIDDQWALIGSSSFRRRGLCFDGSSDIVFTDLKTKNGAAASIQTLRQRLLKQRLGIAESDSSSRALLVSDFKSAFALVRQTLIAGGLGKTERLWNGHTDGVTFSEPTINRDVANPDGITFNLTGTAVFAAFAGIST
ncbi:MAG: hypothetical protein WC716_14365 [Chitinophagaceae bacterium]|jgi:hypothetical protein